MIWDMGTCECEEEGGINTVCVCVLCEVEKEGIGKFVVVIEKGRREEEEICVVLHCFW